MSPGFPFIMKIIEIVNQQSYEEFKHVPYTPYWIDLNNHVIHLKRAPIGSARQGSSSDEPLLILLIIILPLVLLPPLVLWTTTSEGEGEVWDLAMLVATLHFSPSIATSILAIMRLLGNKERSTTTCATWRPPWVFRCPLSSLKFIFTPCMTTLTSGTSSIMVSHSLLLKMKKKILLMMVVVFLV